MCIHRCTGCTIGGHRFTGCSICGSIRCRGTTKWMREQSSRNARQPIMNIMCVELNLRKTAYFHTISTWLFHSATKSRNFFRYSQYKSFKMWICETNIITKRLCFSGGASLCGRSRIQGQLPTVSPKGSCRAALIAIGEFQLFRKLRS